LKPCLERGETLKKIIRAILIVGGLALLASPFAVGTPEYSKKEEKSCTFCHTALGKPDLNEAGKYYKDHDHSLKGFEEKKKPAPVIP
jgi:hypothetical protein